MLLSPQATQGNASSQIFLKPLRQFVAGRTTTEQLNEQGSRIGPYPPAVLFKCAPLPQELWVSFPPLGGHAQPGRSILNHPLHLESCLKLHLGDHFKRLLTGGSQLHISSQHTFYTW